MISFVRYEEEKTVMSSKTEPQLRTQVCTHGTFLSVPGVFKGAHPGVKSALKMQIGGFVADVNSPEVTFKSTFLTDRALIDFGAVQTDSIDLKAAERDCEFIKNALQKHPDVIQQALEAITGAGKDTSAILAAADALEKIGFTERNAREEGGGLLFLLIVAGAALFASGCRGCAHGAAGNRPPEYP